MANATSRSGDKVVVISGADKSDEPREVIRVFEDEEPRPGARGQHALEAREAQPGEPEAAAARAVSFPSTVSNVLLYSEKAGKGVRVRREVSETARRSASASRAARCSSSEPGDLSRD